MGTDCDYYFLTSTASEIWKKGDRQGENRMLKCLDDVQKKAFFHGVIHSNGRLEVARLEGLAEDAWLMAQAAFIEEGRKGKSVVRDPTYVGYFRRIFRNKFFDLQGHGLALNKAKEEFGRQDGYVGTPTPADLLENKENPPELTDLIREMRSVLAELNDNCREFYRWRYEENRDPEWIARERTIKVEAVHQTFWRCKERFHKILQERRAKRKVP